ncbi:MAG: sulfite exporter TauE/SafE family protein [Planctomycetaceae bacterium]|nr:sulfite exporter TauE/SafE family protein [Planctomycetaceae bacterium]
MFELTPGEWTLALLAALGVGVSKSGFAGVGLFHVVVFAHLFGARSSTGIILPMLLVGDISALVAFRQHARWELVRRILPPALVGILIGWLAMHRIDDAHFRPVIGGIILLLAVLQIARMWRPNWFTHVPHATWFAWTLGLTAGVTTMLANAAGPIMALYLLAIGLPKFEFVGTSAWFFFIINAIKVPLSTELGLIDFDTLRFNLLLAPVIVCGLLGGRWLVHRVPQKLFDSLLLIFASVAAVRLIAW